MNPYSKHGISPLILFKSTIEFGLSKWGNKPVNEKFLYNTLNDGKKQDSVYEWEIIENSVDVMVKNDLYTSNTIEIATLSTAINPTITLNLTYTE